MTESSHEVVCDKNVIHHSEFSQNSEVGAEFGKLPRSLPEFWLENQKTSQSQKKFSGRLIPPITPG